MKKYTRIAALAALAMLSITACEQGRPNGSGNAEDPGAGTENGQTTDGVAQDTVFAVNVTPAIRGEINDYIEINGGVQTTTSIDVFSDTAGEVVRVQGRVGQAVRAGDVLAEVDPSRPGQNFALSPVRAPITGTITRLPARVGSQVSPASPVAQISRTNELEVVVSLAERFISKVRVGLPAVIRLDAFPDQQFDTTITELSPVVDPLTRTLEVTLRFNRPDPRIRAGMFAEVRIITEQKDNIVKVPADVMIRRFGEDFVFVVQDDGTVSRRSVTPGIEIDNKLEITSGLEAGERVVYQGQNLLEDGARVRVINTIEPLTAEDVLR